MMPNLSKPVVCEVFPIKSGWKILRDGVRIGLASTRETALDKIMRISENLGVLYRVRIYKQDGSLETEFSCFSPPAPAGGKGEQVIASPQLTAEQPAELAAATEFSADEESLYSGVALREKIALLAYSYWETRGRQGGSPEEDWCCAEREVFSRMRSTSL